MKDSIILRKLVKKITVIFVMMLIVIGASLQEVKASEEASGTTASGVVFSGVIYSYVSQNDTYIISGHTDKLTRNIVLESQINGKSVTAIKANAFKDCSSLASIKIPDSVASIGNYAFKGCSTLTSIEFSATSSLTSIGSSAFSDCSSLTDIKIPNGVTRIENYAFKDCSSLTALQIPSSVTTIGADAFFRCSNLTGIKIPSSVVSIGASAFSHCTSLTDIEIPSSVTSIGGSAFVGTAWLSNKRTENPLVIINGILIDTEAAIGNVKIPEGVTSIGDYAFQSSYNYVTGVEIPSTVTSIGNRAFFLCNFTTIKIPSSVTSIGDEAFSYCYYLTTIEIPSSVTSIGIDAFSRTKWLENKQTENALVIINGILISGHTATGNVVIPAEVTSIAANAFKSSNITGIKILSGKISIGDSAFDGCGSLTSIEIASTSRITDIGNNAFQGCSSLVNVKIPDTSSMTSIGTNVFSNCTSLTGIEIPSGVKSIGSRAFFNCSNLMSIEIPGTVTSIGDSAFSGCSSLADIEIPKSVSSIGRYAFAGTKWLENKQKENPLVIINSILINGSTASGKVKIPEGVTSIAASAFISSSISVIEIPDSVTSIGDRAFTSCSGLARIELPDGIRSIGEYTFWYCTNLTSIEIPSSVIDIEDFAFATCSNLTDIVILNNVLSIGKDAFFQRNNDLTIWGEEDSYAQIYADVSSIKFNNIPFIKNYSILYSLEGGSNNFANPDTYTAESSIILQNPTKDGYTFAGWYGFYYESLYDYYEAYTTGRFEKITEIAKGTKGDLYLTAKWAETNVTTNGVIYKYDLENDTYMVSGYTDELPDTVTIESVINGKAVASIGEGAFKWCSSLVDIEIPSSVTRIGAEAFWGTKWLENKRKENPLVIINNILIDGMTAAGNVIIPEGVTSITDEAFYYSGVVTGIEIPGSVTSIGDSAFSNCSNLTGVKIQEGVKSIGYRAFSGCGSLTSITIPNSVSSIENAAFYGCSSLVDIEIPGGLTKINSFAFHGCSSLSSITIPNNVTSIGNMAFKDCSSLTRIEILSNVTSIEINTFAGCDDLTIWGEEYSYAQTYANENGIPFQIIGFKSSYTITYYLDGGTNNSSNPDTYTAESVITLQNPERDGYTFEGWYTDSSFTTGITEIAKGTTGNLILYAKWKVKNTVIIQETVTINGVIYTYDLEKDAYIVSGYTDELPDSVTLESAIDTKAVIGIGPNAFKKSSLMSIEIPSGITSIGYRTFFECRNLARVEIAGSVTSIGADAFADCRSLSGIKIPNGVTSIEEGVFLGCSSLADIEIPSSVTSIGYRAFVWCSSLTNVELPNSVTNIGDYAFYGCSSFTDITIPNSVTSIGDYAFAGCSNLTRIEIPSSVQSIGVSIFNGIGNENVTIWGEEDSYAQTYANENRIPFRIIGSKISYTITYYLDGGTNNSSNPDTYTAESVITLQNPIRDGYTFEGWYTDSSFTTGITEIVEGTTGNLTLYAEWKVENTVIIQETVTINGVRYTYDLEKDAYIVSGYTDELPDTVILESAIDTKAVIGIGPNAFKKSSLTGIVIPSGITSIGYKAFYECMDLAGVEIAGSVTSIGANAFADCRNLLDIKIPNGVTSIEKGIFLGCRSLADIEIPSSVTSIGDRAFVWCVSLTNIELPSSVTGIGDYAFYGCSSFTDIKIPDSVQSIGDYAFNDCSNLTRIEIPSSVQSIGVSIFSSISKENVTIWGEKDSYAQTYAGENRIPFQIIGSKSSYTITYYLNNGTNNSGNPNTYTAESVVTLQNPTREGYTFEGWYTDSNFVNRITKITKGTTENLSLYAKWTKNKTIETYKVTFDKNGGTRLSKSSLSVTNGKTYGTLPTVVRKGYNFKGWFTGKNGGIKITDKATVNLSADQTLYAQWTKVTEPSKVKILNMKNDKSKQMTVTLKKISGVKGYEIVYSTSKTFKSSKKVTTTSLNKTIKNLKKGKTYYVKVRAYKVDSANNKIYGSYGIVKMKAIK